jgi:FAD:protein FMN transferase
MIFNTRTKIFSITILLLLIGGVIGVGLWFGVAPGNEIVKVGENLLLPPIMSTPQFKIVAYGRGFQSQQRGNDVIRQGETAARTVETKMNIYNPDSELGKFNSASAGQFVKLSPETLEVLTAAHKIYEQTDGAFDVTAKPLFSLWKNCAKTKKIPTPAQCKTKRSESRWADIKLLPDGAKKLTSGACVDLGGIAKGYAIDLAVRSLKANGASAGVVDIGGDVRCFGEKPDGGKWSIVIRDPFESGSSKLLGVLKIPGMSVCTSGNYERFVEIDGKHYTHIINPKTGAPAAGYPSVTVLAPDARTADAWATALSVTGPKGFALIEKIPGNSGIEAMIVVGSRDKYELKMTDGFKKYFAARQ